MWGPQHRGRGAGVPGCGCSLPSLSSGWILNGPEQEGSQPSPCPTSSFSGQKRVVGTSLVGELVKNLCRNARDMGLIPGWGSKIRHVLDQLSPQATARDPECHNERMCVLQLRLNVAKQIFFKKTSFSKLKKGKRSKVTSLRSPLVRASVAPECRPPGSQARAPSIP